MLSADKELAVAVIHTAWHDIFGRTEFFIKICHADFQPVIEARLFLTEESGGWARSRQLWCERADIHPVRLRDRAIRERRRQLARRNYCRVTANRVIRGGQWTEQGDDQLRATVRAFVRRRKIHE